MAARDGRPTGISHFFMFGCIRKEMIVGMSPILTASDRPYCNLGALSLESHEKFTKIADAKICLIS
jgi:hypothetical protein